MICRELDLDNTELGDGGGRKGGSCCFVLWLWVLGVWGVIRGQQEAYLEKTACQSDTRNFALRGRNCACLEDSSNSELHIQINQHFPSLRTIPRIFISSPHQTPKPLITDPNRTLYPPFDSPPSASHAPTYATPT